MLLGKIAYRFRNRSPAARDDYGSAVGAETIAQRNGKMGGVGQHHGRFANCGTGRRAQHLELPPPHGRLELRRTVGLLALVLQLLLAHAQPRRALHDLARHVDQRDGCKREGHDHDRAYEHAAERGKRGPDRLRAERRHLVRDVGQEPHADAAEKRDLRQRFRELDQALHADHSLQPGERIELAGLEAERLRLEAERAEQRHRSDGRYDGKRE